MAAESLVGNSGLTAAQWRALVAAMVARGLMHYPTPAGERVIRTAEDLKLEIVRLDHERQDLNRQK